MKVSHCIGGLRYFVFLDIYAFPCNDFIEQKYVMPGGLTRLYVLLIATLKFLPACNINRLRLRLDVDSLPRPSIICLRVSFTRCLGQCQPARQCKARFIISYFSRIKFCVIDKISVEADILRRRLWYCGECPCMAPTMTTYVIISQAYIIKTEVNNMKDLIITFSVIKPRYQQVLN